MMILQILSAFSAVLVFTMILEIPKKYMLYASASGAVGWWAYLMVQNSGHSSMLAAFLSTLVVAFLSHILARVKKAPVTVFLITGTLPAVPGAAIYRSVYYFLQNIFQKNFCIGICFQSNQGSPYPKLIFYVPGHFCPRMTFFQVLFDI